MTVVKKATQYTAVRYQYKYPAYVDLPLHKGRKVRITGKQRTDILKLISELAGAEASVTLFGSRVDDDKKGGDLDLLVECEQAVVNPAWLAATLSAKLSRLMAGRRVDVVLGAPNLKHLPIHEAAKANGVRL